MSAIANFPSTPVSPSIQDIDVYRHTAASGWDRSLDSRADTDCTLAMVFASPEYADNPAILEHIRESFPQSHLVGCSAVGTIIDNELHECGLTLAIQKFRKTRLRTATSKMSDFRNSFAAGQDIGRQLAAPDLRSIFVLSDGLNVNGSHLARGLAETSPPGVVVSGGLAGDGPRFQRTWVLCGERAVDHSVVAVGFYGSDLRIGYGSRGGWDVFGPTRVITRAEGNILYELDGNPALALYKRYLGERAADLPSSALLFPLTIFPAADSSRAIVRTVLAVDEKAQSMTFAGDMPVGASAQLMRANFDRLVTAAGESGAGTARLLGGAPRGAALMIAVSCIGRRLILGERAEEELDAVCEALLPGDRQIGFYSYGEISPLGNGVCELHNQTMTLTAMCE